MNGNATINRAAYAGRVTVNARAFVFTSADSLTLAEVREESGYSLVEGPFESLDDAQAWADAHNGAQAQPNVAAVGTVHDIPNRKASDGKVV